jgi:hypothetical protein
VGMNQALERYSLADLIAAVEAKQGAQTQAAQEREQQSWRDHEEQVKKVRQIGQFARQNQNPVQWAQDMADAGLPVSAAKVFAEVLATIFNRLEAVEGLSASAAALNDLSARVAQCEGQLASVQNAPPHLRMEKRTK